MIEQIIQLAKEPIFRKFTIVSRLGTRYEVPARNHLSIPPNPAENVPPDYFIVYTNRVARTVSAVDVASIEIEEPAA